MVRKLHTVAQLVLLASALCLAGVATAALKNKPPEGLKLSGTEWQIDPYHSDDPVAVIENAEKTTADRRERDRGGMSRGMPGPADDDTRGRPFPDPTSRSGGWDRNGPGKTSTSTDPWGTGTQSATIQFGSRGRNEFLEQLYKNPDGLTFRQVEEHVTVTQDGLETDCTAGEKAPVADSFGDGERQCGWNGRAWVVETTRGSRFSRTDRYELSKDGKTLKYVTTASGANIPSVRITRMYEIARHPN